MLRKFDYVICSEGDLIFVLFTMCSGLLKMSSNFSQIREMKSDSKVHNQRVFMPGHDTLILSCGPCDPLTSVVDTLSLPFSIIRATCQGSWGRERAGKLKQKKKHTKKNFFWQSG